MKIAHLDIKMNNIIYLKTGMIKLVDFGFERISSQSTYNRFFNRFSDKRNTELFPQLHCWMMEQVTLQEITLDLDSNSDHPLGRSGNFTRLLFLSK